MNDAVFVRHGNVRIAIGGEQRFDLAGVLIEHEDLSEMRPRGAQQVEAVGLGLGQGLLVPEDDAGRIVLDASQRDEAPALQLIR